MLYTKEEIQKRKNIEVHIKNAISIILYIILVPIMLYNIVLIFQSIINPNETPSFLGIKTYTIISGSMEPNINIGDIVIAKDIENEESIKVGDVISFRKGQSVITHRITEIIAEEKVKKYKTKGDNNNAEDVDTIKFENIEGKVIKVLPKLGKLSLLLKNKMVIILILILYYIYLLRNSKIKRRKKERRLKRIRYEESQLIR